MSDLNPTPEFEEKVRMAMNVPDASPEFVNDLRNKLARRPARMKSSFIFRPAWAVAFVLAMAVVVVSVPGVASAIGRLFGYVPNVGLVENTDNLRTLAEPASLMRDGVTLIIKNVFVYEDRVELSYEVEGIAPFNDGNQAEDAGTNPTAFCGGVNIGDAPGKDSDALLRLPDGTILERDHTGKYPQNVFATKPVYEASIPADVTEMTFVLKCIPQARLGAVPENWEVPIKLTFVPDGTLLGEPVIEVSQPVGTQPAEEVPASPSTEETALPAPEVTMTIEKIVPLDSATIFYLSMDMVSKDPSLVSIMPVDAYVIDSLGQKIDLIGGFTWQPFEHRTGSLFEFRSASKPADGQLTVVVENAVAYYAPMYVEPRQATPEEMSFTFDAGTNPQRGQTWDLNNEFEIAGYPLKVTSAAAINWDDVKSPAYIDGSQGYEYGYMFTVETDPSIKFSAEMDIMSESPMCGLTNMTSFVPSGSSLQYAQLCRDAYPTGEVKVTIRELSVLLENVWQSTLVP